MGVSFALINKAIQLVDQQFQMLIKGIEDGIHSSRDLQLNIVYLTNTIDDMDISVNELKDDLNKLSTTYGVDVNTIATEMRMFTRQGYSASESIRLVGEAQKFSKATGEDFTSTVDAMNTVMEVFNMNGSDSAYILKKFNDLTDETGLSVQDISNIFARASPNIRESGYSLSDVVDVLYTLSKEGDAPRTMLAEINDVLKDMEGRKIDILPESEVRSIEEKYAAIEKTTANYWAKWNQGVAGAERTVVDYFGSILDFWADKYLNMYGKKEKPMTPAIPPVADWMDDYILKQKALATEITTLTTAIDVEGISLDTLYQQYERGNVQQKYLTETHAATLAVREQEDAIKRLQRISNAYSLDQQVNNLRIMQIEYGAGRRGPTRGQQRQIDLIERDNMRLRIKEAEQQIAIGNIQQNGLQTAQDALDKIRRSHDQIIYDQELADLKVHIGDVYTEWKKMYEQLARDKAMLLNRQSLVTTLPFVGPPAPPGHTYQTASSQVARDNSRRRGVFDLR